MENASYSNRFFAYILDSVLSSLLGSIALIPLFGTIVYATVAGGTTIETTMISDSSIGDMYILLIMVMAFFSVILFLGFAIYYFAYRPSKHNGQTFGKKWLNIKVVNEDGSVPTFKTMLVRYLSYLAIYSFVNYFVYITIFFDQNRRALYDMVAKTRVVNA